MVAERSSRIPAVPRLWILGVFALLCTAALVLGLVIGAHSSTTEEDAAQTAQKKITATAAVQRRTVGEAVTLQGKVSRGSQETFTPTVDAERSIVTSAAVADGQEVRPGTLLATVSDAPVLAMPEDIPFYRTIRPQDQGSDVRALQEQLARWGYDCPTTGTWDKASVTAYQHFLQAAGAPGHPAASVDWHHFLLVPEAGKRVAHIASPGTVLGSGHPLLTLGTAHAVVTARADLDAAKGLATGQKIEVRSSGGNHATGTVQSISGFRQDGEFPGKDLTLSLPESFTAPDQSTATLQLSSAAATGLAVPLAAVRTSQEKEYVVLHDGGTEVPVQVQKQADGWALVAPETRLREGTLLDLPTA